MFSFIVAMHGNLIASWIAGDCIKWSPMEERTSSSVPPMRNKLFGLFHPRSSLVSDQEFLYKFGADFVEFGAESVLTLASYGSGTFASVMRN